MSFGDTQHFWVVFEQISRSRCAPLSLVGRQQFPGFPDLDDTAQTHSITPIKTTAHWISFSQTTQYWRERTFLYMPGSWCPEKRVIRLIQRVVAGRVGRRSCHADPLTLFSSVSVSLVGTLLFALSQTLVFSHQGSDSRSCQKPAQICSSIKACLQSPGLGLCTICLTISLDSQQPLAMLLFAISLQSA